MSHESAVAVALSLYHITLKKLTHFGAMLWNLVPLNRKKAPKIKLKQKTEEFFFFFKLMKVF